MQDTYSVRFEIINEKGLHARAAAKLVETVERYDATAEVFKDGLQACGNSIMGLLMLAASCGTSINVHTKVNQAKDLSEAIGVLIAARFGEDF